MKTNEGNFISLDHPQVIAVDNFKDFVSAKFNAQSNIILYRRDDFPQDDFKHLVHHIEKFRLDGSANYMQGNAYGTPNIALASIATISHLARRSLSNRAKNAVNYMVHDRNEIIEALPKRRKKRFLEGEYRYMRPHNVIKRALLNGISHVPIIQNYTGGSLITGLSFLHNAAHYDGYGYYPKHK